MPKEEYQKWRQWAIKLYPELEKQFEQVEAMDWGPAIEVLQAARKAKHDQDARIWVQVGQIIDGAIRRGDPCA